MTNETGNMFEECRNKMGGISLSEGLTIERGQISNFLREKVLKLIESQLLHLFEFRKKHCKIVILSTQ